MGKKNWFLFVGAIGLTFFGIPLRKNKYDSDDVESLFNDYIIKYNKTYKPNEAEYMIRMENFKQSLRLTEELNKNRTNNSSALYGITVYADLSQDEFKQLHLQTNNSSFRHQLNSTDDNSSRKNYIYNYKAIKKGRHKYRFFGNSSSNDVRFRRKINKLPSVVDWRKKNVVGSVHNQRTCGACWAFSVVETIESMNAIKNGTFLPLSVQEAIDCAGNGNYGCEGGDSCALLEWLIKTETKITTEREYPFAYHTQICKLKVPIHGVQVKSSSCDQFVDAEDLLLEKLASHGPVAAAVNALNWQYYLGGVIQFHCSGSPQHVNHVVQIVGYDLTGQVPHYIIRNSWGSEFGDNGYLYIAIGGNICGIANEISSLDVM